MQEEIEVLRLQTAKVILALRMLYLKNGANPLKHWTQIAERLMVASKTSSCVAEWYTTMMRGLYIAAPSKEASSEVVLLAEIVDGIGEDVWLELLDREHGYIVALSRLMAEERRSELSVEKLGDATDRMRKAMASGRKMAGTCK